MISPDSDLYRAHPDWVLQLPGYPSLLSRNQLVLDLQRQDAFEYVLGAIIVPSGVCLTWLAFVGATAIDLELRGVAQGAIVNADISSQLFTTINLMLPTGLAIALSVIVVVLLLTFLITSADSGVLIINTLASGGNQHRKGKRHIVVWGAIFTVLIGALLTAGGLGALRSAMIIGALPFSAVMALMAISLVKVMRQDIQSPIQH